MHDRDLPGGNGLVAGDDENEYERTRRAKVMDPFRRPRYIDLPPERTDSSAQTPALEQSVVAQAAMDYKVATTIFSDVTPDKC